VVVEIEELLARSHVCHPWLELVYIGRLVKRTRR
jgi:hypothetical protein